MSDRIELVFHVEQTSAGEVRWWVESSAAPAMYVVAPSAVEVRALAMQVLHDEFDIAPALVDEVLAPDLDEDGQAVAASSDQLAFRLLAPA